MTSKPDALTCGIYLRMSTTKQDNSIDRQRELCEKHAAEKTYRIVDTYCDSALSGSTIHKRPEFLRFLADAGVKFSVMLVDAQDRAGRFDSMDFGELFNPVRRRGAVLESVLHGRVDWHTFAGRTQLNVLQDAAEKDLSDTAHRVLSGMVREARKGNFLGGPVPFGCIRKVEVNDKGEVERRWLVIDPARKEIVLLMFRMAKEGRSLLDIQRELQRRGVASPRGGRVWSPSAIVKVLRNPVYCGMLTWGRRSCGIKRRLEKDGKDRAVVMGEKAVVRNTPEQWIVKQTTETKIISVEDFEAVQRMLEGRRLAPAAKGRKGYPYLLAGLVYCGECGHVMYGRKLWGNRPAYVCGNYLEDSRACGHNPVREDNLVGGLLEFLQKEYLAADRLESLRTEIRRLVGEGTHQQALDRMKKRLAKLDRDIDRGARNLLLAREALRPRLEMTLTELVAERDKLAEDLQQAEASDPCASLEDLIQAAEAALWQLDKVKDEPDLLKPLLRQLVTRIDVSFENWTINGRKFSRPSGARVVLEGGVLADLVTAAEPSRTETTGRHGPGCEQAVQGWISAEKLNVG